MRLSHQPPSPLITAELSDAVPWDNGQSLYVQGLTALRDGRIMEAVDSLTRALRRQPTHRGMRRNLTRALLAAGRFEQALLHANVCLEDDPQDAELHFARGSALNGLRQPVEATAALTRAIALRPDHAPSWLNLANAWADLDDLPAGLRLCREAVRLEPALAEAHASLAYLLTMTGQLAAAIEACETALRLHPDFSQAHWNMAIAQLLSGDLPRGFASFEWRKRHAPYCFDFPPLPQPEWRGSKLAGETVLVRAEQGAGDTIQFARFLPAIIQAGGVPMLTCTPALVPLMRSIPGLQVVSSTAATPKFDTWIDLMTLPHVLGTTLDTIPDADGYLSAEPARVTAWRDRLPEGRKIGVALVGNPLHRADRRRSIPAAVVGGLPTIPGTTFINLQVGRAAARIGLPDLTERLTDYAETAALIENLDLVICVDTSVAHLAGALGKPVWVLVPASPDWRWLLGRADSPWYSSVRLMRQPTYGDWRTVLSDVMRELRCADTAEADGADRHQPRLFSEPAMPAR